MKTKILKRNLTKITPSPHEGTMKFDFFAFIQERLLLQEGIFCFGAENPSSHAKMLFPCFNLFILKQEI